MLSKFKISVFRYRRSPRKSPYFNKTRTPNADPKTPKRLFTPTANQNFLSDFQVTPPKSGRRGRQNLPSPVKFHKEEDKDLDNGSDDDDDQVHIFSNFSCMFLNPNNFFQFEL